MRILEWPVAVVLLVTVSTGICSCSSTNPGYYGIDDVERSPVLVAWVDPVLPDLEVVGPGLKEMTVQVLIGPGGYVREARLHHTSGSPELDRALLAAARGCVFEPADRRGRRVPAWSEVYYVYPEKPLGTLPCGSDSIDAETDYRAKPSFPYAALKDKVAGEVELKVYILPSGSVAQAVVVRSSDLVFNDSCRAAARRTRFIPASSKCKPVASWSTLSYRFEHGAQ